MGKHKNENFFKRVTKEKRKGKLGKKRNPKMNFLIIKIQEDWETWGGDDFRTMYR